MVQASRILGSGFGVSVQVSQVVGELVRCSVFGLQPRE